MIRRPLTEITLKLDDVQEYENLNHDQAKRSAMAFDLQKHYPKSLGIGPKSTEEILNRIGYAPKKKPNSPSTV